MTSSSRASCVVASVIFALAASCTDRSAPVPAKPQPSAARASASVDTARAPKTAEPRRLLREDHAMGTTVTVQVFAPDDATLPTSAAIQLTAARANFL